jgi:hypothetical protein
MIVWEMPRILGGPGHKVWVVTTRIEGFGA